MVVVAVVDEEDLLGLAEAAGVEVVLKLVRVVLMERDQIRK